MLSLVRNIVAAFSRTVFPSAHDELVVMRADPESLRELAHLSMYRNISVLFSYKDETVRALIWQLKYKGDMRAAELLGGVLSDTILSSCAKPCVIVPIPLSVRRVRERGYNQVTLAAEEAGRHAPMTTIDSEVLIRTVHTKRQTYLRRKERFGNVLNAFSVQNPERLSGAHVILLDDVVTTGSTLEAARNALSLAGVRDIRCVAFAH